MQIPDKYQIEAKEQLINARRFLLADEQGVGKTLPTVLAALEIGLPTLVICPASLKIDPWARLIEDQDPKAQIQIIEAGNAIKDYKKGKNSQWLIVNYDLLEKYSVEDLKTLIDYKTIIIDEAHSIKETKTLRTKAALKIGLHADNVFLITGTPILNRPMELYPLLKIAKHPITLTKYGKDNWYGYAFRYCSAFRRKVRRWTFNPSTRQMEQRELTFLDVKGASNLDELRQRLQGFYLRRMKAEVQPNLPKKEIKIEEVPLTKEWQKLYNETWDRYMQYLEKIKDKLVLELGSEQAYDDKVGNIVTSKHLVELQKLRQVTSHAKIKKVSADAFNLVRNENKKVIIFASYTDTLKQLKKIFDFNKIKTVILDGSTKSDARTKAKDSFQEDPDTKIFLGNIKAAGIGITLHASHRVLFIDREWTPGINEQAEDRSHRRGQKEKVIVTYYDAIDTVDEDARELLEEKRKIISSIWNGEEKAKKDTGIGAEMLKRSIERSKSYPHR